MKWRGLLSSLNDRSFAFCAPRFPNVDLLDSRHARPGVFDLNLKERGMDVE